VAAIRPLTEKETNNLRHILIRNKDKAALKRLKKRLVKSNEYRWLMKEYRKSKYKMVTY